MTNFEPIKSKIWDAVKKDDKKEFDRQCDALMEKAVGDWWRIGWNIHPKDIDELAALFENLSKSAHQAWIKAMEIGDAPPEDVSPGEGFSWCAKMLRDINQNTHKESN